jgi:hypothetical protein
MYVFNFTLSSFTCCLNLLLTAMCINAKGVRAKTHCMALCGRKQILVSHEQREREKDKFLAVSVGAKNAF